MESEVEEVGVASCSEDVWETKMARKKQGPLRAWPLRR